ncbi:hypothetical protein EHS25_002469 [Saitozyma podzolica]|uniref:Uncharacterized protein n=1 Tax=Saitozyma podzolica TaxID=1890683 RepID=A0A427YEG9_9TREE|nr:hypothetical protein EHS25_002469 [Saitozyma podzolica]
MLFRRTNKFAAGAGDSRSERSFSSSFKVLRPRGGGCMNCTMLDTFDDRDPIRRYRPAKGSVQEERMKERLNQKGSSDGEPAYEPPANSFALGTTGGAGAGGAGGGAGAGGSSC